MRGGRERRGGHAGVRVRGEREGDGREGSHAGVGVSKGGRESKERGRRKRGGSPRQTVRDMQGSQWGERER